MLSIIYADSYSYLRNKLHEATHLPLKWVVPHPQAADSWRKKIIQEQNRHEVFTVSKFLQDLLLYFDSQKSNQRLKRKSDILMSLLIVRNKLFPQLSFERFIQAYDLFSAWRGFTLDPTTLDQAKEIWGEETVSLIQVFFHLLNATGEMDEHAASFTIAEELRRLEQHDSWPSAYVFASFQYLNGMQIDLIKALSIRTNVFIVLPRIAKEITQKGDWPDWLKDHKTQEWVEELPDQKEKSVDRIFFNSRFLVPEIQKSIKGKDNCKIILGKKKLETDDLGFITSTETSFQIPFKPFEAEIEKNIQEIYADILVTKKIFSHLESDLLEKKNKIIFKKEINWVKELKVIITINEIIQEMKEIVGDVECEEFHLKFLKHILELKLPRLKQAGMSQGAQVSEELCSLMSLDSIGEGQNLLFCVDERWGEPISFQSQLGMEIEKILSTIGPIRRSEFELKILKAQVEKCLFQNNSLVFMPNDYLKTSMIWYKLFEDVKWNDLNLIKDESPSLIKDGLGLRQINPSVPTFSPTKLQVYVDCPRRYYYQYREKIFPIIKPKSEVEPSLMGAIAHKIIEIWQKRKEELNLLGLILEQVSSMLQGAGVVLDDVAFRKIILEISHKVKNGLFFLTTFDQVAGPKLPWQMETSFHFEEMAFRGQIDCAKYDDTEMIIFDFKSSSASAGTPNEILQFQKVQLWMYLLSLRPMNRYVTFGYVVLDRPQNSIIFTNHPEYLEKKLDIGEKGIAFRELDETPKIVEQAKLYFDGLLKKVSEDKTFHPSPRHPQICKNCELNLICLKGEVHVS